jgi:hypothetical protein
MALWSKITKSQLYTTHKKNLILKNTYMMLSVKIRAEEDNPWKSRLPIDG